MPEAMTLEDAETKICPFMATPSQEMYCMGSGCACWGWVDGARGQQERKGLKETISRPVAEHPEGEGWTKIGIGETKQVWSRARITGPRRGRCEAGIK